MVSSSTILGKLVRLPLRFLPGRLAIPVLQGPLAGRLWIVGSSNHGCWFGTYEQPVQKAFAEAARRARTVFDIGAQAGFYTMLASVVVGARGRVVAFEPVPGNLAHIRDHVRLNGRTNVTVLPYAVTDISGVLPFDWGPNSRMGSLSVNGTGRVTAVTLDEIARMEGLADPDLIKIDVEGAEYRVLTGGEQVVRRARPTIFLATHGDDLREGCERWLKSVGYRLENLTRDELVARPSAG